MKWVLGITIALALVLGIDKAGAFLAGQKLRASGTVLETYLAELPEKLTNLHSYQYCKRYTAGRFRTYQLCVNGSKSLNGCEASPIFKVWYWAPPMNLVPGWREYYFNMPYGALVSVIDGNKQECAARMPENPVL